MKKVSCDIFRTDFTPEGLVPIFENIGSGVTDLVYRGAPINYNDYATFLNLELQKLRHEVPTFINKSPLTTTHTGSFVKIELLTADTIYMVTKMRLLTWLPFFDHEHKFMLYLHDNINAKKPK